MEVVVIRPNCKYRVAGINRGRSFVPKVGRVLDLPDPVAAKELKTKNVRRLLPEEKDRVKPKTKVKKKKVKAE
ncbi:MAG TPA: hypothetical protein VMW36_10810 [Patescibacteria group bacterium]|nr:hypothetical protein [Patescibacteria group bacterium]